MSSVLNNFGDDTICAIATAMSDAGIGIIRVSGKRAVEICDEIYVSTKGEHSLHDHKPNTIKYGFIVDESKTVNEKTIKEFFSLIFVLVCICKVFVFSLSHCLAQLLEI